MKCCERLPAVHTLWMLRAAPCFSSAALVGASAEKCGFWNIREIADRVAGKKTG